MVQRAIGRWLSVGWHATAALSAGVAIGLVVARGEVWVKCRSPASERCVWAAAMLKLTAPVYLVIIGIPVAAGLFWLLSRLTAPNARQIDRVRDFD